VRILHDLVTVFWKLFTRTTGKPGRSEKRLTNKPGDLPFAVREVFSMSRGIGSTESADFGLLQQCYFSLYIV